MKKTLYVIAALSAALSVTSCYKEIVSPAKGEGSLSLGIELCQTKAALSQDELLANAKVGIYMADFSGLVREYKYSEAPASIVLPADEYRVDVLAGEAAKATPTVASWEQKSYKGSKNFTITAGATTTVSVEAKVSNAVTRISFDQSVADNFAAGYTLTIGLGSDCLVYDSSRSGSDGYFIIDGVDEPSFDWTFTGTLSKDGSAFTKTGKISNIEAGKAYAMTAKYTIKDGEVEFSVFVDHATDVISDIIVFEGTSTGLAASNIYEIWAGHATVHADVDEAQFSDPTAVKFAYRASGASDWTTVDAVRSSEGVYNQTLTGLTPSTTYEYKLVIGGVDQGDGKTFTTEAGPNVPNSSFETISKVPGKDYYRWWDGDVSTKFWGSGNGDEVNGVAGSAGMGFKVTVPDDNDKVDGARSVCAQSGYAVVMLAAGNIFSGSFNGLVGMEGGKVKFGRPWTSRPTGVRLWVKYSAGTINRIKNTPSGVSISKSDYDRADLKVAIGTWDYKKYGGDKDSPILVNTTKESTFVDYSTDASTIAFGEAIVYGDGGYVINGSAKQASDNTQWRQITIPLEYHTQTAYPTHIVLSFAASMFGDYFTGCDSAKLWLDKIELLYE